MGTTGFCVGAFPYFQCTLMTCRHVQTYSIDCLSANKLSLNVNKTKFMVFHSDKKRVLYPKLFIDAIEIDRVDYFNFLGLQLNHTLKWNKQLICVSLNI